jgi:hypothetical protein
MKKKSRKTEKNIRTDVDMDKLYRLQELVKVDLKEKMEIMAGFAQELLRLGRETIFLAAVPKGDSFFFLPTEIFSHEEKEAVQRQVIDWATENGADCIVSAFTAWASPHRSGLRPSKHPHKKEVLSVVAKDKYQHVVGMQEIRRRGKQVSFGALEYADSVQSWLDDYKGFHGTATAAQAD